MHVATTTTAKRNQSVHKGISKSETHASPSASISRLAHNIRHKTDMDTGPKYRLYLLIFAYLLRPFRQTQESIRPKRAFFIVRQSEFWGL
jgi:hypothetical protein